MKIIKITLILALFTFSCSSQNEKKKVISKFIEKVILTESYDISKIDEFININTDSLLDGSNTLKQLSFYIDLFRHEISDNKFKIITYKEFKSTFKEYHKEHNIVYKSSNEIFWLVSKGKLITFIIISENNKIISFYSGLIKDKSIINPFLYEKN